MIRIMPSQHTPQASGQPLAPIIAGGFGVVAGFLLQFGLTRSGASPLVPPYSLSLALGAIAVVALVFGLRLKRAIADSARMVDPFQAVRVLVVARAGALVGALFGGAGAGFVLSLIGRSVAAPASIWLPMAAMLVAGLVQLGVSLLVERWCRVPPGDGDENAVNDEPQSDTDTQTAYRQL